MNGSPTILLADDSENDVFLMRVAFKKAGFSCALQSVCNGEQAVSYLSGEGVFEDRKLYPLPSILLLDLNMPRKNGFEVLAWARDQPAFKRLSIVIMTASTRPEDIELAFQLDASSYLVKPSIIEALTDMIRCLRDWMKINRFPPV